jgi:hypothetical protein
MAEILTVKLKRNGWPEDEEPRMMEESLLVRTEGVDENENERFEWFEYRLNGLIVKRGGHMYLKRNVAAEGVAAMIG